MIRKLVEEAGKVLRESYYPGQVLLIEAPTGYGKSVSAPLLAADLCELGFAHNLIHVLPLRAIVADLYVRTYLGAFDPKAGEALKPVKEAFERMGLEGEDVAYQMGMDALLRERGKRKSPLFDARAVVTTLDSFAYNLLRLPVSESFKAVKHYATVRARIFTAAIFMDEAHMVLRYPEEEDTEKMLAFMKVLVEYAQRAKTPLIVMSATIGSWFKQKLREWSGSALKTLSLGKENRRGGAEVLVKDPEYEERAKSVEWKTEIIGEGHLASKASELAESGWKVLVVRSRVRDAVRTYKAVEDRAECVLLHGQLTSSDRDKALDRVIQLLEASKGFVAVATPVIEAGVNWSFDAAFVEAANAFSMVQVVGRVRRSMEGGVGHVYVIESDESDARLLEWLRGALSRGYIDWRLPFDYSREGREAYGYHNLIELMSERLSKVPESLRAHDAYKRLVLAAFPPSRYVKELEETMGYSVLREPLAQVVVGFPSSGEEALASSVSYDLSLVKRLREYVRGFVCVGVDEGGEPRVKSGREAPSPEAREYVRFYESFVGDFVKEHDAYPLVAGYVVDERAYEPGVGFAA